MYAGRSMLFHRPVYFTSWSWLWRLAHNLTLNPALQRPSRQPTQHTPQAATQRLCIRRSTSSLLYQSDKHTKVSGATCEEGVQWAAQHETQTPTAVVNHCTDICRPLPPPSPSSPARCRQLSVAPFCLFAFLYCVPCLAPPKRSTMSNIFQQYGA